MEIKIKGANQSIEIESLTQALKDKNIITIKEIETAKIKVQSIRKKKIENEIKERILKLEKLKTKTK